jgi:hypothetical protein
LADRLRHQRTWTQARCGVAPSEDQVLAALSTDVSDEQLDGWLLDSADQRRPTVAAEQGGHLRWFVDPAGAFVMFVPTACGSERM